MDSEAAEEGAWCWQAQDDLTSPKAGAGVWNAGVGNSCSRSKWEVKWRRTREAGDSP